MTTQPLSDKDTSSGAIWMAMGLAIGSALGASLGDVAQGSSLGLMLGATITMTIDYRRKKLGAVWPIVGGAAFLWIVALTAIEHW